MTQKKEILKKRLEVVKKQLTTNMIFGILSILVLTFLPWVQFENFMLRINLENILDRFLTKQVEKDFTSLREFNHSERHINTKKKFLPKVAMLLYIDKVLVFAREKGLILFTILVFWE